MNEAPAVPLLDLKPQYRAIRAEVDEALRRVVESQQFILGPEVEALEKEVAAFIGAPHAVGCASGSDALLLALLALNVGPGDEVIVPTYTFFATAGAVARLGARPVFVDLDPTTYNLDPAGVRTAAARCRRLRAVIPVHLYGQCAEMGPLETLGEELRVPLIEDAAQSLGSRDERGRNAGCMGKVNCFSFFPTKNLGGFGDGGMITTADAEAAEMVRVLRVHGSKPKYYHKFIGFNSRLDALQAAVLRVKLRHLDSWTAGRRSNAEYYDRAFLEAGARDSSIPLAAGGLPLRIPRPARNAARHVYNQYVIRVPAQSRDPLIAHLRSRNVGTEIYYPIPLHLQECFAFLGQGPGSLPHAEAAARETIALPIFPELTVAQRAQVVKSILEFLQSPAR